MSTLHLHVAIPCIVALAGIVATSESSAAAREHQAAKPRAHHVRLTHGAPHSLSHRTERNLAHDGSTQVVAHAAARGARHAARADAHVAPAGGHIFSGMASFYSEGQTVASGGKFNPAGLTCAHRTLPFGTHLRVADPRSGRSVVVTVNDRGPFVHGRVLDLSLAAARAIGLTGHGVMRVTASVI